MKQGTPTSIGTTVATNPTAPPATLEEPRLPEWLTHPEPAPLRTSKQAKALLHATYEQIFERVIEQVYRGRSLRSLLEDDSRVPSYEDFIRWVKRDPVRHERFKEAQEARTEFIAGEILEIADATDQEVPEDVNRSKLRIDTRKWLMSAWHKKRYGEVKQVELAGSISITEALAQANARVIDAEVVDVTPRLENSDD